MERVRVKICGVRTVDDVRVAVEAGADAVGLNFHPPSPRFVDLDTAATVVRSVPPFVEAVGVFVNATSADMQSVAARLGLRSVQWHGDAGPPREEVRPYALVPAYRVQSREDLRTIVDHVKCSHFAAVLVDAHVSGEYGGTGHTAPWNLLADFDPGVPLILAGGLTPENVAEAIRLVRPYAVDVASGVESSPGVKDADKVRRFLRAVRSAF
ncbi:MAG: phosphoribosylanthranilate isomerase [Gemmataceae bacterium]